MYYLGVDTSAYTTSLAVVDIKQQLIWEAREVLSVPMGETGLAQSEAFFQHVQRLPVLIQKVPDEIWDSLEGVGVSMAPRPVEGSYMPVFTAGYAVASTIAAARRRTLFQTTHQEGHIAAGIVSAPNLRAKRFLAVHMSGGTTELLHVECLEPGKLKVDILGGTTDLHAGQFVDRIGVLLGLEFPSGSKLEQLAANASEEAVSLLPSSVQGFKVSFSGVETAARRLYAQGTSQADLARAVEGCIARTIYKLLIKGIETTGLHDILVVGGVAANEFIRLELQRRLSGKGQLYYAHPNWSRDNAIGVACLTHNFLNPNYDSCAKPSHSK